MAIIKCKMCGGELNITEGESVAECEYCGSRQTIPAIDDEKKLTLFARANRLRLACEFDKASGIYESIVAEFPEEAEAYWGLVLCKYGIEYVDDPATGKKIPTCHRSSFDSVMEDSDFEQACENADGIARKLYREEAKQIESLRRGILEVSGKEEPYDIFICYKETDENRDRTLDSVLAQDIYDALTGKGYRVFFSRITLEDKLGQEYEPYIFAALNSAKIMLAVGTDYEYYNAVWVKNEWSRYLKLMTKDKDKHLIPCYKNLDAYDMPKEFARLQAQDLGKVGAMQDLLRGVEKILGSKENGSDMSAKASQTVIVKAEAPGVDSLLKRGQLFLEDHDWTKADEYFDKVLDIDPECAMAYVGKALAKAHFPTIKNMEHTGNTVLFQGNYWTKAVRFADNDYLAQLRSVMQKTENAYNEKKKQELSNKLKETIQRKANIEQLKSIRQIYSVMEGKYIAAGRMHTVALRSDGTVVAIGANDDGQCNVSEWTDIVAISARERHTVGLRNNGTVVATGNNYSGQCDVSGWTDIVAVSAGENCTVGLRNDGTVVVTGKNNVRQCDMSEWTDIVAVSASENCTVGLRNDGTVVAKHTNGGGRWDEKSWTEIVAVSVSRWHMVGLRNDGTVVATGTNGDGRCEVSDWRDVVAVSANTWHTVGLRKDGTVVATGDNIHGQCDVSDWTDIVAVCAGIDRTIGLHRDGTVVSTTFTDDPQFDHGQCDVGNWKLFNNPDTLEQEKAAESERRRQEEEKRQARLAQQAKWREAGLCQHCGGTFKGLFTKKCTQCGMPKDY